MPVHESVRSIDTPVQNKCKATDMHHAQRTRANIEYFARNPELIDDRLEELDREWSVERVIDVNAATIAFGGGLLSVFKKRYLLLSLIGSGLLVHNGLGRSNRVCDLVRYIGFRTAREIEAERYALKASRGDFDDAADASHAADATGRLDWSANGRAT